MGIAMNGVIADNVRIANNGEQATIDIQLHHEDSNGKETRASGSAHIVKMYGRWVTAGPLRFNWLTGGLCDALASMVLSDRDRFIKLILAESIKAAKAAADQATPITARELDLSE